MAIGAVLVAALLACGRPTPSPAAATVHFGNATSQAVLVSIAPPGAGQAYLTGLRPCGGSLDVATGRELPADGDVRLALGIDPTASFDSALAAWSDDPHDLPGHFDVAIIWSSDDLQAPLPPTWIDVEPTGVSVLRDAPAASSPSAGHCEPWAYKGD